MERFKIEKLKKIEANQEVVDILTAKIRKAIEVEYRDYLKTMKFAFTDDSLDKMQTMKNHLIESICEVREEIEAITEIELNEL